MTSAAIGSTRDGSARTFTIREALKELDERVRELIPARKYAVRHAPQIHDEIWDRAIEPFTESLELVQGYFARMNSQEIFDALWSRDYQPYGDDRAQTKNMINRLAHFIEEAPSIPSDEDKDALSSDDYVQLQKKVLRFCRHFKEKHNLLIEKIDEVRDHPVRDLLKCLNRLHDGAVGVMRSDHFEWNIPESGSPYQSIKTKDFYDYRFAIHQAIDNFVDLMNDNDHGPTVFHSLSIIWERENATREEHCDYLDVFMQIWQHVEESADAIRDHQAHIVDRTESGVPIYSQQYMETVLSFAEIYIGLQREVNAVLLGSPYQYPGYYASVEENIPKTPLCNMRPVIDVIPTL